MIDVLIVGAGPTGLMLALLLKRQGLSFRLIDENDGPAKESRALAIQARTLELFHKLGIIDKFLDRGTRARGIKIHVEGQLRAELNVEDMARADTQYPYIFLLSQSETEKILLEELERLGVKIERGTSLLHFSDSDKKVLSRISSQGNEETITSRFLCGCDGSHSRVRNVLGLDFKGGSYEAEFVMADARVDWPLEHDKLQLFIEKGDAAVFFPIMGNHLSRVIAVYPPLKKREGLTETTKLPATLEEVENGLRHASHLNVRLSDPAWVTRFHVHHRCVDRFRSGNVFLLGDAAHIHSPAGGQGMNTGLQDANNLAWKIRRSLTHPEISDKLLETYHEERFPVAQKLLSFTDRAFVAVVNQNKAFQTVRNLVFPVFAKVMMTFPAGKRALFRFVSQLNIHYGENFSIRESGHRLPDFMIEGERIHNLMREYDFYRLVFKGQDWGERDTEHIRNIYSEAREIIISDDPAIFRQFGIKKKGLIVVRPDGYICRELKDW